jgi:uncharacterized protein YjiS (DUF1127 family)
MSSATDFAGGKPSLLSRIFTKIVERRRAKQNMRRMLELGDHILRDIGVTRHDIVLAMRSNEVSVEYLTKVSEENSRAHMGVQVVSSLPLAAEGRLKLAA